jgi:hypothetical protein
MLLYLFPRMLFLRSASFRNCSTLYKTHKTHVLAALFFQSNGPVGGHDVASTPVLDAYMVFRQVPTGRDV